MLTAAVAEVQRLAEMATRRMVQQALRRIAHGDTPQGRMNIEVATQTQARPTRLSAARCPLQRATAGPACGRVASNSEAGSMRHRVYESFLMYTCKYIYITKCLQTVLVVVVGVRSSTHYACSHACLCQCVHWDRDKGPCHPIFMPAWQFM